MTAWLDAWMLLARPGGPARISKETSLNCNVQGPQGPEGKQGPIGATGATGPAGISGYEIVTNKTELTDVGKGVITGAECPPWQEAGWRWRGRFGQRQLPTDRPH